MEEIINNKTRKLKDAEKQLKGLAGSANRHGEDEAEISNPRGPLLRLTVEPGDSLIDRDTEIELNTLMDIDKNTKEQNISTVEAAGKDTAEAVEKYDKLNKNERAEKLNPLANLINSLPEVSAQELVSELEKITKIIRERQQG